MSTFETDKQDVATIDLRHLLLESRKVRSIFEGDALECLEKFDREVVDHLSVLRSTLGAPIVFIFQHLDHPT